MASNQYRRRRRKRGMETSKKLLLFADGLLVVVSIAAIVAAFVCKDTSPFAYLVPAVSGLAATSHGFYYWKAKNENMQKYGQQADDGLEFLDLGGGSDGNG